MLTQEQNDFVTRVGPRTPMGDLFRRFWVPALLTEEVLDADGPPVRVRLLGEDLIAFRTTSGDVGLVQNACPHRGASMFFGRNEEDGLRCVYHGWKFDTDGRCVDMPNEPAESNFRHKIFATAYPCREAGGVVWAYLGPAHLPAELPELEWLRLPQSHVHATKQLRPCNYLQALEGDLDSSHASFLHATADRSDVLGASRPTKGNLIPSYWARDGAPRIFAKDTDYGILVAGRREADAANFYWRLNLWLLPFYAMVAIEPGSTRAGCNAWVPMDDEHCWVFRLSADIAKPLPQGGANPQAAAVASDTVPGSYRLRAALENDFLIDREQQRTYNFTGIQGVNAQDEAMTVSMGGIMDRSKEHLGTADAGIISARRKLTQMAHDLQAGVEPYAAQHGDVYRVRPVGLLLDRSAAWEEAIEPWLKPLV